jgi:hypothetical protein
VSEHVAQPDDRRRCDLPERGLHPAPDRCQAVRAA